MNESLKNRQDNRHTCLFIYKENDFPFLTLKSNAEHPKLTESLKSEKKFFNIMNSDNSILNLQEKTNNKVSLF